MRRLAHDFIYIVDNYRDYRTGLCALNNIQVRFDEILKKISLILEDYEIEYNNIQGKPNIPFIPLITIRNPMHAINMTVGIYVAILIKQDVGIYISLNQGIENKAYSQIRRDKNRYKRRVADIILNGDIKVTPFLLQRINLHSNITGNTKRARAYEEGNIVATFYDKQLLANNYEQFLRDLIWFIELYRRL